MLPRGPDRLRRTQLAEHGVGPENFLSRHGKAPTFPKVDRVSEFALGSPPEQGPLECTAVQMTSVIQSVHSISQDGGKQ